MLLNLTNPIPQQLTDSRELSDFYKRYGIIPYYGTTEGSSNAVLNMLDVLCSNAPTFGQVEEAQQLYTFGLNGSIVQRAYGWLNQEEGASTEVPIQQQIDFLEHLKSRGIQIEDLIKKIKRLDSFLRVCGNGYVIIKRATVAGVQRYEIEIPHFRHVAYIMSKDTIPGRFLIVSPFLGDEQKLQKYPPLVLMATQYGEMIEYTRVGDIDYAIIHVKRGSGKSEGGYYDRSRMLDIVPQLYVDYKLGVLSSKIAATDIISLVLLAFEAPHPNTMPEGIPPGEYDPSDLSAGATADIFKRNMLRLKELTTQLGGHPDAAGGDRKASTIAGVEYPHGGKAPIAIDLQINRDTAYQKFQWDYAMSEICAKLHWAPELLSKKAAASTLGGNLLYDLFVLKNESTIKPMQLFYQDLVNYLLSEVVEEKYKQYGVWFNDVISAMIEKFSAKATGTNTNASQMIDNSVNTNSDGQ